MAFLDSKYLLSNASAEKIFPLIENLPVVDPHNHADVAEIAANANYVDPWRLFAATDHYVWEMLRKCEVPEPYITGDRAPEEKFLKMAEVFPRLVGNPVYEWVHLDLKRYLGVTKNLSSATGKEIYDELARRLSGPGFRPQQLLMGPLNVEVMCSTDDLIDTLEHHEKANASFRRTLIRPTWRPDKAMKIGAPGWRAYMEKVEDRFGTTLHTFDDLTEVLKLSHDYFAAHGCVASDHGVEVPPDAVPDFEAANRVFQRALKGETLTEAEISVYQVCFLLEAAALNAAKSWVFQLHMGAVRDVRHSLFRALGPDVGGDVSSHAQNPMPGLLTLLNHFDGHLKVVLYCLDPGHQATLATLARAFGSTVRLGSAWWLCDTPVGMRRQLEYIGSVDLYDNFAGMVSDSRKLLSYGSRFEMFRRVLADVLGAVVERGQAPFEPVAELAVRMAYENPKRFFNL